VRGVGTSFGGAAVIRIERDSHIGILTLARPERRNALTPEMLAELAAAIGELGEWAGSVLVRGEGPVFCAGFDLGVCRDAPDGSAMRRLLTGLDDAVRAMRACPAPVVVACQGAAIAGGCALVAGGDFAVADRGATLGYPVVRLGVSPAVTAPTLLPRVGGGAARARMLDPGLMDGERAHRIGLVSSLVVTPDEVGPAAAALAAELAAKPRAGMRATKRWLNHLDGTSGGDRGALEVSLALAGGEEERALLGAFWSQREGA
jgi:2-(1,2-epoxy-1,2-dihydrophenyl)acetyl-CoA isomerase